MSIYHLRLADLYKLDTKLNYPNEESIIKYMHNHYLSTLEAIQKINLFHILESNKKWYLRAYN